MAETINPRSEQYGAELDMSWWQQIKYIKGLETNMEWNSAFHGGNRSNISKYCRPILNGNWHVMAATEQIFSRLETNMELNSACNGGNRSNISKDWRPLWSGT